MGRVQRNRKRPRSSSTTTATTTSSPWRAVNVFDDDDEEQQQEQEEEQQQHHQLQPGNDVIPKLFTNPHNHNKNNHYDDRKLAYQANRDLEAESSEPPGVFFGLEVLDGSQYKIEQDKRTGHQKFIILSDTKTEGKGKEEVIKKKESTSTKEEEPISSAEQAEVEKEHSTSKKKRKKKRKKKKKAAKKDAEEKNNAAKKDATTNSTEAKDSSPTTTTTTIEESSFEIQTLSNQWMSATGGLTLHPVLCQALYRNGWHHPTPIQAAVLPAAILGRRNIVGAAPTGSGKSLAFLIPIYQYLLEQQQEQEADNNDNDENRVLQALILTPTRELALQIHVEADKLCKGRIGTLVGGLAVAKQQRVLNKHRPAVLTATPGRLWDLISSRDYKHLNDLSHIRFLVIDEADRMVQQGNFPQLAQILDAVQRANPMKEEDDDDGSSDSDDDDSDDEDGNRLIGLPGVRGEAKVTMLSDDILKQIENAKREMGDEVPPPAEAVADDDDDDDDDQEDDELENDFPEEDHWDGEVLLPARPPVERQTFVYSATLTLPASAGYKPPSSNKQKKKHKKKQQKSVDGAIAEILEKAKAKGKTKIVDLSNASALQKERTTMVGEKVAVDSTTTTKAKNQENTVKFRLPEGLELQEIKCTQRHKDSHLYAYLMTTYSGAAGPALVFCNSIAAVRRVGATLQTLGFPVRMLHAHMQQRARFKAVESLQADKKARTIVVATDVAARGLDIPSVATVIHYDAARTMETFIHRSGRTARGVGKDAVGCSLSLVAPDEDKFHVRIVDSLQVNFSPVPMDGRLLNAAQERVSLASQVVQMEDKERKTQRDNQWFREKAEEAGLELDDDLLDEGLIGGDKKDVCMLHQAKGAKVRLGKLLSQPMQTQRFGKFLSTNSAAMQRGPEQHLVMPKTKKKKRSKVEK